jgi:hypothetical protein
MLARKGGSSYKTDLIEYCAAGLGHLRTGHKTLRQKIDFFNFRIIEHRNLTQRRGLFSYTHRPDVIKRLYDAKKGLKPIARSPLR